MRRITNIIGKSLLLGVIGFGLAGMQGRTNDMQDRLLSGHNRERAHLGLPQMRWNADLARSAKQWASHLAKTRKFKHSRNIPGQAKRGENLWAGTAGAYTPEAMVGLWLDEKRVFKRGTFPHNSKTGRMQDVGHYTQMVWKDTREVGCAVAHNSRREILVCHYSKPGNIIGRKPF